MFPDRVAERTARCLFQSSRCLVVHGSSISAPFVCPRTAQARQDDSPTSGAPQHERWEGASSILPALSRPTLAPQTSTATLSSSTGYESAVETRRSSSTAGFTPISAGAASGTPGAGDSGQKKLPWEGKEARYVIGSGELGLLNELQMPRRGSIVPLDRDFLRLPRRSVAATDGFESLESPLAGEPLVPVKDDRRMSEPGYLFSPIVPSARQPATWERDNSETSSMTLGDRPPQPPQPPSQRPPHRPPPARAAIGLPGAPEENTLVGSADAKAEMKLAGGDNDSNARAENSAAGERTRGPRFRGKATLFQEDMRGQSTVRSADARPPVRAGSVFGGELASAAARKVETASAAERIAAFRPGTRFRVAVDKGLTGLGITVKEIRGRFFVYKLQALADGSPGAAEVRVVFVARCHCFLHSPRHFCVLSLCARSCSRDSKTVCSLVEVRSRHDISPAGQWNRGVFYLLCVRTLLRL